MSQRSVGTPPAARGMYAHAMFRDGVRNVSITGDEGAANAPAGASAATTATTAAARILRR